MTIPEYEVVLGSIETIFVNILSNPIVANPHPVTDRRFTGILAGLQRKPDPAFPIRAQSVRAGSLDFQGPLKTH
jgi:hypothetical protein